MFQAAYKSGQFLQKYNYCAGPGSFSKKSSQTLYDSFQKGGWRGIRGENEVVAGQVGFEGSVVE